MQKVGIIGYGFVGRGTAHALEQVADVAFHDPVVVGSEPLTDIVKRSDVLIVCVPTPMASLGEADLSMVMETMKRLSEHRARCPIILKSTVPPGTSERMVHQWPSLSLVFCPEFLRERHSMEDSMSPSRVVLGWTTCSDLKTQADVRDLYARAFAGVTIVEMVSTSAELLKYAANALFGVKVSFANEMAELAESLGVAWEPVRAALVMDPRVGDGHLAVPGDDGKVGFGGACLPKDISGLMALAKTLSVDLPVVSAAQISNNTRRRHDFDCRPRST